MAPLVNKPNKMVLCTGCKQVIKNNQYFVCITCKEYYDIECANLTERQYKNLKKDDKLTWECPECQCKKPKINNSDTPIRPHSSTNIYATTPETNVTFRNKSSQVQHYNDTVNSADFSILGDTMETNIETNTGKKLTLHNLSELITIKLKENNKSITQEIQSMIKSEINIAILKLREDIKHETNNLFKQNDQRKAEIEALNIHIARLNEETESLQREIKKLVQKSPTHNSSKKFVLYGLMENKRESEYDLQGRLINIFRETLQTDLSGYIEDTYRMGKLNHSQNRPLVIELMSKRMVKYLITNKRHLYGTGLNISEFLNNEERKQRNVMKEKMLTARKQGLHAVIRNNKLYIEGKLLDKKDYLETNNTSYHGTKESTHNNNNRNSYADVTSVPEINGVNQTFRKNRPTI